METSPYGVYMWPGLTEPEHFVERPCNQSCSLPGTVAKRYCTGIAEWNETDFSKCRTMVDCILEEFDKVRKSYIQLVERHNCCGTDTNSKT